MEDDSFQVTFSLDHSNELFLAIFIFDLLTWLIFQFPVGHYNLTYRAINNSLAS